MDSNSSTKLNNLILDTVKERYPGHSFIYFYGSFSRGENRLNSDIDLMVVYETAISSFREKFVAGGILFDVFVYDAETLNGSLHKSRETCVMTTVDAVIDAVTLPDSTATSKMLKLVAERVKKVGYFFNNIPFVRQFVTNILDDLHDSHNEFVRNMLCIDLYKVTVDIILLGNGVGKSSRKYAATALNEIDNEFQPRLDDALKLALNGDVSEIEKIAIEVLDLIGGQLREGFRQSSEQFRMPLPVI